MGGTSSRPESIGALETRKLLIPQYVSYVTYARYRVNTGQKPDEITAQVPVSNCASLVHTFGSTDNCAMNTIIKSAVSSILGFAFLAVTAWGEFGGIVHAFTKHSVGDGFAAICVPPWAWYRSVEFFSITIRHQRSCPHKVPHLHPTVKRDAIRRRMLKKPAFSIALLRKL